MNARKHGLKAQAPRLDTPEDFAAAEAQAARWVARKLRWAWLVVLFERLWPRLWAVFALAGIFLLLSLSGFWTFLPAWLHKIFLGGFALATAGLLVFLFRTPLPDRRAAVRLLERRSGLPHRPVTTFLDRMAGDDPQARRLWERHRTRLLPVLSRLRVGLPRPDMSRADPYGLRALLILCLVLAWVARGDRLAEAWQAAFTFAPGTPETQLHLAVWLTPPAYTGQPPRLLREGKPPAEHQGSAAKPLAVPIQSELVVRVSGAKELALRLVPQTETGEGTPERVLPQSPSDTTETGEKQRDQNGEAKPVRSSREESKLAGLPESQEFRLRLTRSARLILSHGGHPIWTGAFRVIPDTPPAIALMGKPGQTARSALRLRYRVADDYGVVAAEARLEKVSETQGHEGAEINQSKIPPRAQSVVKPIGEPPVFPLHLPRKGVKRATAQTYKDLTAHPWAGMPVRLTLLARDAAGQVGYSQPITFVLPARKFHKPLARAIIEQRRLLAADPRRRFLVARALDALTIAPERYIKDLRVYLGLRSAYWRLRVGHGRAAIEEVVDQLWHVALRVEDGGLSEAERALRAAQDRLMDALANNAPQSEIQRLMRALREALNRFLQSLMKRQTADQPPASPLPGMDGRTVTSTDLARMLRDIETLAKSGAREAARQMLSQLRNLLEGLQTGQAPSGKGQGAQMMQMLDSFSRLMSRQQKLLDQTYRAGRKGTGRQGSSRQLRRGDGRQGQGEGSPSLSQLQRRQEALRRDLEQLLSQLGQMGAKVPAPLQGAGEAMEKAGEALARRKSADAVPQQSLALDRLRKGARALADQIMQQMARQGRMGTMPGRDPLGRLRRTRGPDPGLSVKIPKHIDIQRAREILEELRRRLADPDRPTEELEYLERLIERF